MYTVSILLPQPVIWLIPFHTLTLSCRFLPVFFPLSFFITRLTLSDSLWGLSAHVSALSCHHLQMRLSRPPGWNGILHVLDVVTCPLQNITLWCDGSSLFSGLWLAIYLFDVFFYSLPQLFWSITWMFFFNMEEKKVNFTQPKVCVTPQGQNWRESTQEQTNFRKLYWINTMKCQDRNL